MSEIEDSKDNEKVLQFSEKYNLDFDFSQQLIKTYKLSLTKLEKILEALSDDRKYPGITNLPFIANRAFKNDVSGIARD